MLHRICRLLVPAVLLLPITAAAPGGWSVVTVHTYPDFLVAGEPFDLRFTLRAHGMEPIVDENVKPRVNVDGDAVPALRSGRPGVFTARITAREPGQLSLVVEPHYGPPVPMPAIPVVAPGGGSGSLSAAVRGGRLFTTKGCAMCHVHAGALEGPTVGHGGELTGRRYNAGMLRTLLRDPDGVLEYSTPWRMPELELTDEEIDALIAFING